MKSPFKFLDAYKEKDKDIFFGRDTETEALYKLVYKSRILVIYGQSGTGKTSLIQCGLANRFDSTDWLPFYIRRVDNINQSLRKNLAKRLEGSTLKDIPESINSIFKKYLRPVYLIFDQLEELFILGSEDEHQLFIQSLTNILNADLPCKILLVIQEEYIGQLFKLEESVPYIFDHRFRLEKMYKKNLHTVIENTANSLDIQLEEPKGRTISWILENIKNKDGYELIDLQIYLDRLYRNALKKDAPNAPIIFDEFLIQKKTKKIDDVLSDFLREQLDIIDKELDQKNIKHEGLLLDILFALVTRKKTKLRTDKAALIERLARNKKISKETIEFCLDRFMESRLIKTITEE
jgi:GTPase SAR1 family protein